MQTDWDTIGAFACFSPVLTGAAGGQFFAI
jgi:hypothetical protein